MSGLEKKFATKSKIVNYIINRESTSKVEISKELNLSMPTVLSNVKDLLEKGVIIETGEYESTGGRKAKSIGINPSYRYAMGIVITANHLGMVLVNLKYEIVKSERIRLKFVPDMSYCSQVADLAERFLDNMNDADQKKKLLGIGISIPGIINQAQKLVIKSHALRLENYSLSFLEQAFSVPVYFSNDANAAMMAEDMNIYQNAIYLSLNQTLGGAFCIGGKLFSGENQKAGEFGHMILVPQGRKCYCGKSGCADAYCAAGALVGESKDSVEQFMQLLQSNDEKAEKKSEDQEKLTVEEQTERYQQMTEKFALLGIPVIVDRSEDEQTDLAKYEWIKVYGVLFGCEDQMNNLFDQAVKDAGDDAVSQAKVQTEK